MCTYTFFHKVHNIKTQGNHNDFTNVVVHILLTPVNCALFCWKIRVHNISIYAHCNFKNLDFSMIYEIIIDLVHILLSYIIRLNMYNGRWYLIRRFNTLSFSGQLTICIFSLVRKHVQCNNAIKASLTCVITIFLMVHSMHGFHGICNFRGGLTWHYYVVLGNSLSSSIL